MHEIYIPVVMMADLITAGDQYGWADLRRATMAEMWGHDMDVPDIIFQFTSALYVLEGITVGGVFLGHAATIFIPGALISGYIYTSNILKLYMFGKYDLIPHYLIEKF